MRNAAFLIWMFGWPVIGLLIMFIDQYLCGNVSVKHIHADPIEEIFCGIQYLSMVVIYLFIAYKLYEEPSK